MGSCTLRLGTRCAIGAAFALGVAGLAPATASSETGPAVSLPAVASPADLAAAVESAVEDAVAESDVDDVVATVLDPPVPTPVTAPERPDDADEGVTGSTPVAAPPVPESAETRVDTTAQSADTTSDTPATAPESAPREEPRSSTSSPTVAAQVLPTNVNVSVRVASPGDNGAVTQMNVTTASSPAPVVAATTSSQTPADRPAPVETGRSTTAVSPAGSPTISSPQGSEGTWTWDWDCLSLPTMTGMSSQGSTGGITPSNWIWNWNCGTNTTQYHNADTEQYRPINVNVGIRISSPGNDGPVSQANVVVAIGVGAPATPPVFAPPTAPTESLPVVAPAPEGQPEAAPSEAAPSAGDAGGVMDSELGIVVLEPADDFVDPSHGAFRPGGLLSAIGPAGIGISRRVAPSVAGRTALGALPTVAIRPWSTAGALRAGGGRQAHASSERTAVEKTKPRWTRSRGIRGSITPQSSGTSVAPAGAGSSSSGGLPLVLALPFLAAVLDMARRRVLDRVATPSGHRSRVPDDPG